MSEKVTAMIEEIKGLTVLELSELVHALEEEFGFSAAAMAAPAAGAAAPAPGSNEACLDCQAQAAAHSRTPAAWSMAVCRSNAPTPKMIHFQPGRADRS